MGTSSPVEGMARMMSPWDAEAHRRRGLTEMAAPAAAVSRSRSRREIMSSILTER
jgi:hypothetical protein